MPPIFCFLLNILLPLIFIHRTNITQKAMRMQRIAAGINKSLRGVGLAVAVVVVVVIIVVGPGR